MSDAYSPITTSRTLESPQGHKIYTTTRTVPMEYSLPSVGELITASNFIAGFDNHYILSVSDTPKGSDKRVTVMHSPVPVGPGINGEFEEYESIAYTFPPLYPTEVSAGVFMASRERSRVVPARVLYQFAVDPADFASLPSTWDGSDPTTGPFEVWSGILLAAGEYFENDDGSMGLVGDFLNTAFISSNTINNGFNISAPGDLSYDVPASIPDIDTYYAWLTAEGGSEIMASRTMHKWYSLYMLRTTFVKAQ